MITAERYHDICCGHRVVGQGGKCERLHGHNYRVHFTIAADNEHPALDQVGRVLDFSVIKDKLCMWIEEHWDHKFLAWTEDKLIRSLRPVVFGNHGRVLGVDETSDLFGSIVWVPFNPTAENMAEYLCNVVAPEQLAGTNCRLTRCKIEETAKCSATYEV